MKQEVTGLGLTGAYWTWWRKCDFNLALGDTSRRLV